MVCRVPLRSNMRGLSDPRSCSQNHVPREEVQVLPGGSSRAWGPHRPVSFLRPCVCPGLPHSMSLSPMHLNHLCPSTFLYVLLIHSLFFCLCPPCSAQDSPGERGRGSNGEGLLTVTVADSSSSVKIQPACFRPCPSTWHCNHTLSPTSTEALGIWTFTMGTPGHPGCPRGVREGSGLRTLPQSSAPSPNFLSDPSPPLATLPNLQSPQLLPMPLPRCLSGLPPSSALCPLPASSSFPAPHVTCSTYHS